MSKYIIDIPKTVGMGILGSVHYTYFDGIQCQTIVLKSDEIEELNSDYINEHYGDLQDDAYERGHGIGYQKGFEDGKENGLDESDMREAVSYQRGLNDAWECAKKLFSTMSDTEIEKVFPVEWKNGFHGLMQMKPQYAIAKLKAYEEKQNDKIEVGDEVAFHHDDGRPDTVVVVTYIEQDGFIDGMDGRGTQYAHKNPTKWTKTGRHFDIDKILEEMRND